MSPTELLESTNFDYSQFRICLMIFVSNTVGYMRITGVLLQIVVRQLRLLLKGWDRVASLTTLAYSDLEVGLWQLTQWEQLCFEESGRQLLT